MNTPRINENERKVLAFFADNCDEYYFPFASISLDTNLDRGEVRRVCRSLKRKGLAEFRSGLWTEDGEVAGSGYRATKVGYELFGALQEAAHEEEGRAA